MTILLVYATETEALPIIQKYNFAITTDKRFYRVVWNHHSIWLLITGIGTIQTLYYLTAALYDLKPDFIINAGIAGTFSDQFNIGEVVKVSQDEFADIGFFDKGRFKKLPFENGIHPPKKLIPHFSYKNKSYNNLPSASSITVNIAHYYHNHLKNPGEKLPDIETMEGAAVFYACAMQNIPCIQIRAVSNRVGDNNKKNWDIPLAVINLSETVSKIIAEI